MSGNNNTGVNSLQYCPSCKVLIQLQCALVPHDLSGIATRVWLASSNYNTGSGWWDTVQKTEEQAANKQSITIKLCCGRVYVCYMMRVCDSVYLMPYMRAGRRGKKACSCSYL